MANVATAKAIYNGFAYPALSAGARLAAVFSSKLRKGLLGRRKVAANANDFRESYPNARVVLFHCASAGELEGIKPLAAACRQRGFAPCVSYFSPSAEATLHPGEFEFADFSPYDSVLSVRDYYSALKPEVILISKHDVWPNMVWQAAEMGIPIWLINGNFHPGSLKSLPGLRYFHQAIHSKLDGILTVSEDDAARAKSISGGKARVAAVGDSRYDRVCARAEQKRIPNPDWDAALRSKPCLIGGSTHEKDESLLLRAFTRIRVEQPDLRLLVVPHDPSDAAIRRILDRATAEGLLCSSISDAADDTDVWVINQSGILADLYQYGTLAFVGGGFDRGIHSVLEPMVHGLPVICGPNIAVSREARDAQTEGLLFTVATELEAVSAAKTLLGAGKRDLARRFVERRAGVGGRILDIVLPANGIAHP